MNKISPFLRRCLLLLPLALMVASDSTAQGFEQRIVFESNRDGDWDIYSMDVNGNNLVQLTDHPALDGYPACSPDGRRIAFASERGVTHDLYVMDSDGKNVVTHPGQFFRRSHSAGIRTEKFAFASNRDGNWDIYSGCDGPDGNNLIQLKTTRH